MPSVLPPANRQTRVRRVLAGILVANLVVVVVKFSVGIATGSLAVLGDAIQSSLDAVNNVVGLMVIRVAHKAPDEEHPYGHAKFETLGALLIVVFLSVSIFELLRGAVERLLAGAPPPHASAVDFGLIGATLVVNILVAESERRAGRRLGSEFLLADAMHTRMDVVITVAVLLGLALAHGGLGWADPALAIIVAGLVAHAGYGIVRRALPTLVDERAYDEGVIRREAETVTGVHSAYAIRSRSASDTRFAELTIAVDGTADVASAHLIADAVEARLRSALDVQEVVVHVEPC